MSQANVDLVREGFEAFLREGLDGMIELFDADIEVHTPLNPETQRFEGHDGLRRSLEDQVQTFDDWRVEPVEYVDLGEHVAVVVEQHARGRGSGVEVKATAAWLFTLRDGKAVRLALLRKLEDARAEARNLQSARQ